jgi:hypothetical protein
LRSIASWPVYSKKDAASGGVLRTRDLTTLFVAGAGEVLSVMPAFHLGVAGSRALLRLFKPQKLMAGE